MNFRQLEYFTTAARLKSISKAAQELHVAQPPVSRQIALLDSPAPGRRCAAGGILRRPFCVPDGAFCSAKLSKSDKLSPENEVIRESFIYLCAKFEKR